MKSNQTKNLILIAILYSIIIVLQLMPKFGIFAINLPLIPIIIGSIIISPKAGGLLGFLAGVSSILLGEANLFLQWSLFATWLVVLLKGTLAGFIAGFMYRMFKKKNFLTSSISTVSFTLVNTLIFVVGCFIFFKTDIQTNYSEGLAIVFTGFVGMNFVFEILLSILIAPVIQRIVIVTNR